MSIQLIAHRCGTDRHPQLTIESAEYSLGQGACHVELDIRFTRDNIPVVSHNDNALELFGSPVKINRLTCEEFLSLRYCQDARYSAKTLGDFLQSGIGPVLLHIKEGGERIFQIMDRMRAYNYGSRMTLGLASLNDVEIVRNHFADIPILAFLPEKGQIPLFEEKGADIIRLWEEWLTPEDVKRIHDNGKAVWVMAGGRRDGSVGSTAGDNLLKWRDMGVDGVLVDKIDWARAVLGL